MPYESLVSLLLRIILGAIFISQGLGKTKGRDAVKGMVESLGFKPGAFWAFLLTYTELLGGIAILIGFASKIAAVLLFLAMLVALYAKVFVWKQPFMSGEKPGYDFVVLILAALLALFLLGAGNVSVDAVVGWRLG